MDFYTIRGPSSFAAFTLCVPAANWMIGNVGQCVPGGPCLIPVGFGLMAPSGVLMIGLALVLRDAVHESLGPRFALAAIGIGCALSLLVAPPALAVASTAAFGFSELANHAVYSRLRASGRWLAVAASGVVGAFLDSLLFVWIAFGSVDLAVGTTLAKIYASAVVAAYLRWRRL